MTVRYYLGVDGGQSSTAALIADEAGRVLGAGRGGPCNHVSGPEARQKFINAVGGCVGMAVAEAGLPKQNQFASVCLGFSGGAQDKEALSRDVIRSERYMVTHDAEIALVGALAGEAGIIVIAGTGSMAFGRNRVGDTARAGGWGYIFGDEGGGFDLVRRALKAALRMEEGWGPATALRANLLEATGAANANELMHRFYTPEYPRSKVAGWAPLVTSSASKGDEVATAIVDSAASDLAGLAAGVHGRLFGGGCSTRVAHIGGVFRSELMRAHFARYVGERTRSVVQSPRYPPVAGALIEAMRRDGNRSELVGVAEADK